MENDDAASARPNFENVRRVEPDGPFAVHPLSTDLEEDISEAAALKHPMLRLAGIRDQSLDCEPLRLMGPQVGITATRDWTWPASLRQVGWSSPGCKAFRSRPLQTIVRGSVVNSPNRAPMRRPSAVKAPVESRDCWATAAERVGRQSRVARRRMGKLDPELQMLVRVLAHAAVSRDRAALVRPQQTPSRSCQSPHQPLTDGDRDAHPDLRKVQ